MLLSCGNKVEMLAWAGSRGGAGPSLVKTAFYDAPLLITSLNVVKDYILLGDVHKGLSFVRYVVGGRGGWEGGEGGEEGWGAGCFYLCGGAPAGRVT